VANNLPLNSQLGKDINKSININEFYRNVQSITELEGAAFGLL
jgi:hypothetical protein